MSRSFAVLSALALALAACDTKDSADSGEPLACTQIAVTSVNLTVLDAAGAPLAAAPAGFFARFSIDGGAAQPCESWSTAESFACGIEQEGSFLVQIGVDEVVHDEATVVVEADECHVIGEALELQLDA
jgi:hypothetical protein